MKKNNDVKEDNVKVMTEDEIINKLMEVTKVPEATYQVDRLGIQVTLKGLSEKEINTIKAQCTYTVKVKGQTQEKFRESEFNTALIEAATIAPNWNNEKLLEHFKASDGKTVIKKKFLAGEISALGDKILDLSGFNDELEEIEDIKNE